jgi:hypothetical protein
MAGLLGFLKLFSMPSCTLKSEVPLRMSMAKTLGLLIVGALACSCAHRSAAPAAAAKDDPAAGPQVMLTHTSFVIASCPDSAKMDSRAANAAMRKMVEPCAKAPGGAVRFQATLLPGGRIELASETGDRAEGVVPICVLKNKLTHSVVLKERCTFDVKLEERSVPASQGSSPQL